MNEIKESFIGNEAVIIIEKVVKRISHEIRLARHKKQEILTGLLEKLGDELKNIESVLAGASKNSTSNQVLILWLEKIEKVVYEADDLLDEWSYADLDRDVKIKQDSEIMRVYDEALLYPSLREDAVGKVKALLDKIQGLYDEATRSGIKPVKAAGGFSEYFSSAEWREQQLRLKDQRLFVEQESLYGRKEDFDCIMNLLGEASNSFGKLNVIGIVGMAGFGKTTLSHQIEKSQDMKGLLFDEVIFIVVSDDYGSIGDFLKKVAYKVLRRNVESYEVISELRDKLRRKKYLLILDDVWRSFPWNKLSNALDQIGGSKGTTILVTSRERKVVQNMMSTHGQPHIHTLKGLDDDDSWSLFKNKIITGDNDLVDGEKKDIAKKLIRKCGGNPLAINVLGGLLRKNSDVEKWREFMKSKEWAKYDDDDEANVLASLKLSFTHLKSPTLKSCFSYCAVFEEDQQINKVELIRLWMAQGILPERDHVEMEVVGEECFNELLDSSLLQEPSVFNDDERFVFVKMHDLVRDLARDISKRKIVGEPSESNSGGKLHCQFQRSLLNARYQRMNIKVLWDYVKLRALILSIEADLESVPMVKEEWKSIGTLKHLRFLDITIHFKKSANFDDYFNGRRKDHELKVFYFICHQIAKLYHLQTLRINGLDFPLDCRVFPECFRNLVNLRHLEFPEWGVMKVVDGLGNLTNLQTLPYLFPGRDEGKRIENWSGLQNLNSLKELRILDIRDEEEARNVNMGAKSSLKALLLRDIVDNKALEVLKPTDISLNTLTIIKFMGTALPTWLTSTGFSRPNLTKLYLNSLPCATGELDMRNFTHLREMSLIDCKELRVVFPEEGFECCKLLEKVYIRSCSKVDSIPNLSPLTKLHTLYLDNNGFRSNATARITQDSLICKSLTQLDIEGDPDVAETIPDQLQHFVALKRLSLRGYTKQEELPDHVIANMTSLESIVLADMPQLCRLPSESTWNRLSKLKSLSISRCPYLKNVERRTAK